MRRLLILLAALLLAGCAPRAPWRQEAYVFGTRVELLIAGTDEALAQRAAGKVLREFDRMNRAFHAWRPSELSALNEAIAAGRAQGVGAELAGYLREAQGLAARGDHLFDPGIGRLIGLWGFQADEPPGQPPDAAAVAALVARHPSIADLAISAGPCRAGQPEPWCVRSRNRAVAIDFGGYLKGVALDRAAALLHAEGVHNALINIGGNIMALGSKTGGAQGTPWRVGIQHPRPRDSGGAPLASLELRDGEAIGTSGDYHRFFEAGGIRYCHLIDPRSGWPANATRAVTVLAAPGADAGMRSDALSKPVFIAGEDWRTMARAVGADAVLRIGADGHTMATAAMAARLKIEAPDVRLEVSP